MKKALQAALVAMMLVPTGALAQGLDKWKAAFNAGDYETALKELRPFADQGDADAQAVLGLMYRNGIGVPQDYAEAAKWYRLAAEQSVAYAQKTLGLMYRNGKGVPQDYAEAAKWYLLAAEQGDASAQFNLAETYNDGEGVPQDFVAAHMWANIASANGDADAAEIRDSIAQKMTPADISEAQRRARVCMASDYQDCG